jgi:KaiC/GvpD/RAD55 family RecA-like ATPase
MSQDIDALKKAVSLREIAGQRVKLTRRGGEMWGLCPFHTERTPSFAIKMKNGEEVFHCQGCKKGGDVIEFIQFRDKCDFKAALEKLRTYAGANREWQQKAQKVTETFHNVVDDHPATRRSYSLADWAKKEEALAACPEALAWLENERGIRPETAREHHLGYQKKCDGRLKEEDEWAREKGWLLFPRIYGDKIVAVKLRSIVAKAFSQYPGMEPKALFNTEAINGLDDLFLTEGDLDCLTFDQCGFTSVSLPNATPALAPADALLVKKAPCIFLSGDQDSSGIDAKRQLQHQLGHRTYILKWPGVKDANEFFLKVCNRDPEIFRQKIEELKQAAYNEPVEGCRSVLEMLRDGEDSDSGNDPARLHLPWPAADRMSFNPPGSVVFLYSTYSGTGKTVMATQIAAHMAKRGRVVVVLSLEIRGEQYKSLLAAQWLGAEREEGLNRTGKITREDFLETARLLQKTYPPEDGGPQPSQDIAYYLGDRLPEDTLEKNLDFIQHTCEVIRPDLFVIDTFLKLAIATGRESTTEAESKAVKRLEAIGNKYKTTFLLIGQSNKEAESVKEVRRDEYGVLRGSREMWDSASEVYLLHRKRKAREDLMSDDSLEMEAELLAKKGRFRGPGDAMVKFVYIRARSKFVLAGEYDVPTESMKDMPLLMFAPRRS